MQASAAFAPYRALRQVAEHRLARLMQLGLGLEAPAIGRLKTQAQLLLAATVANLTRLWAATKEATARIAETAAHRHAQPGADPSPPGPSMAPGYPCQASQYPLFDWTSSTASWKQW